jgi:hypothetical protein
MFDGEDCGDVSNKAVQTLQDASAVSKVILYIERGRELIHEDGEVQFIAILDDDFSDIVEVVDDVVWSYFFDQRNKFLRAITSIAGVSFEQMHLFSQDVWVN